MMRQSPKGTDTGSVTLMTMTIRVTSRGTFEQLFASTHVYTKIYSGYTDIYQPVLSMYLTLSPHA